MNPNVDVLKCLVVDKAIELYNNKKYGIACDEKELTEFITYLNTLIRASACPSDQVKCAIDTLSSKYANSCNPKYKHCNREIYTHICKLVLIDETVKSIPCRTVTLTLLN